MKTPALRFWREDRGQDLTEYALLLVLVSLSAISAMNTVATEVANVFSNASTNLNTAS